jgi:glutathionylspermidine synthase
VNCKNSGKIYQLGNYTAQHYYYITKKAIRQVKLSTKILHKFCATIYKKTVDNPQKLWYYIIRKEKQTLHTKRYSPNEGNLKSPEGKTATH